MNFIVMLSKLNIQWSDTVKLVLIIASAVTLIASLVLLTLEIIGKDKKHVVFVLKQKADSETAEPLVAEEIAAVSEVTKERAATEPEQTEEPNTVVEVAEEIVESATEEDKTEEYAAVMSVLVGETTESKEAFLVDGKLVYIMYDRSFMAKLIQSPNELKAKYSELKSELLSYGVKSRLSWDNESFYTGRTTVVKFGIRGKTLAIYLGLNPQDYENTKYIFEDEGASKRYKSTPMRVKLRSDRAVRWAKELISDLMAKLGLEKKALDAVDYSPEYLETDVLVAQGLIKVYTNGDGTETAVTAADFETIRREKFYQINKVKEKEAKAALEPETNVVEEPVAEPEVETIEEPVAEPKIETVEEPAAEPKVETIEEPVAEPEVETIEEPVAEPEVETIEEPAAEPEIDATFADEMITDEEAKEQIEIVEKPSFAKSSAGKLFEINVDTLCENFESGEKVTIEALKERHLISKKAGRIKVLARGYMTKSLTVYADAFSLQAVKMITLAGGCVEQFK